MTEQNSLPQLGIAIGSLGTVGLDVARRIDGGIPGLKLQAVSALHRRRAEDRLKEFHRPIPVLPLPELAEMADVVVECAPSAVFRQVAESAIQLGRVLIPISVGALIDNWDLVEKATKTGARINIPTGALVGLDAVRAAAQGTISRVTIITRKPPAGLAGSSYLINNNIHVDEITEPTKVFEGTARSGVAAFPANVNVAAALGLAGIGPDHTMLEICGQFQCRIIRMVVRKTDEKRTYLRILWSAVQIGPGVQNFEARRATYKKCGVLNLRFCPIKTIFLIHFLI